MGGFRRLFGKGGGQGVVPFRKAAGELERRDEHFERQLEKIQNDKNLTERERRRALEDWAERVRTGQVVRRGGVLGMRGAGPGEVAIPIDRGRPRGQAIGAGTVAGVPGITQMERMSIRIERWDMALNVLSQNRLPFDIELIVNHRLDAEAARDMFLVAGKRYDHTVLEPILTQAIRTIAFQKTEEEMMDPKFAHLLTEAVQEEFAEMGLAVGISVKSVRPAQVVAKAYEAVAAAKYEKMRLGADMEVLVMRAKLAAMELALKRQIRLSEADIEATVQNILAEVQIDLERQRRQPDFITEAYLREKIINAGGGAMFADALGELAQQLADLVGEYVRRK